MQTKKQREPDVDAQFVGYRILMLRTHCRLSQDAFAKKIGCMPYLVSNWEAGKSMLSMKHLLKIADTFGVSLDYFNPKDERPYSTYLAKVK